MLKILGTEKDLEKVTIEDVVVKENVKAYLHILDDMYEADRDVFNDDGGYAIIIENKEDLKEAEKFINLEDNDYEYAELVGQDYVRIMKLCNNEFSLLVFIRKDFCPANILDEIE